MTKKRLGYSPPKERCTYNIIQSVERRENIRENKKGLEERERERRRGEWKWEAKKSI